MMARTTRKHLPPDKLGRRRRGRKLSIKPIKQRRANDRAALRKEHR